MKLTEISNELNDWLDGDGPHSDIVISSRIRLARNLAEYKFLSRCSNTEKSQILERLKEVITSIDIGENIFYISIDQANELDRNFLVERHLISRHHALGKGPRGAVISRKESFTAMINEEDHLRIQVIKGGLQLGSCWEQINRIDDMIEQQVDYAFSPKYGYLTACPTNLGTGVRVSVMLHLPALKITGQVEKLLGAARDMNLAVRGLFGEGTEATGDFYQVCIPGCFPQCPSQDPATASGLVHRDAVAHGRRELPFHQWDPADDNCRANRNQEDPSLPL